MRRRLTVALALGLTLAFMPVYAQAEEVVADTQEGETVVESDGYGVEDHASFYESEATSGEESGDSSLDGTVMEDPVADSIDAEGLNDDASNPGEQNAQPEADSKVELTEDTVPDEVPAATEASEEQLSTAEVSEDASDVLTVRTLSPEDAPSLVASVAQGANAEQPALTSKKTLLGEYWRVARNEDGSYGLSTLLGGGWLSYEGSAKTGSRVVVSTSAKTSWVLNSMGGGVYSLTPAGYTALRLALDGGATTGTTFALALASEESAAQRFILAIQEALTEAVTKGVAMDASTVTLESASQTGKTMEIQRESKANSANVDVYTTNGKRHQKFVLVSKGSNLYMLQSANSGKYVEVRGGATTSGSNVTQYAANGKAHQLWYFIQDGSGFSIRNAVSGLALTVAKNSNIQVETPSQTDEGRIDQRFLLTKTTILDNGTVYRLIPSYATGLQMEVAGNSTAKGANVQLGNAAYVLGQYWRVAIGADEAFSLVNLRSGYALASKGAAKHKADVQVSDNATGTPWIVTVNDDGTLTFRPRDNHAIALDIPRASTQAGANVWLYNASADVSKAQRFVVTPHAALTEAYGAGKPLASEVYSLILTSTPAKGINIRRSSMKNSAEVILYTAGSGLNEKYQLSYVGNGLYTIQAANSGKYLELNGGGTTAGTKVQQYSANAKLHQYWYLVKDGSGYSIRSAKSGLAMALEGDKTYNGTGVVLAKAQSTNTQRFTLKSVPLVADGTYGIAATICNPLVLDVSRASKDSGGNVIVYIANGKTNQQFVFKRLSDGSYTIQNKNSGRYLEVKGSSKTDGANIQQGTNSASSAQKWKIEVSPKGGLALKNVTTGKYLEFKGGAIRLSTNVQQAASSNSASASFVTVKAGYNPVVGKIGWQNPEMYPQVSRYTVTLPSYAQNTAHSYVSSSTIRVDATRAECIEAFIARAYDYLNAGSYYREPWAQAPGGGIDCSGLVLQCLYATGMDLEHAAGSEKVGGYNPYNHATVPAQTYNSARWYENNTFKPVSTSVMERGDLVYYGYYYDGAPVITHVAIYLGNNQIIHSTDFDGSGNKVRTDNVYIWNPIGAQRPFV